MVKRSNVLLCAVVLAAACVCASAVTPPYCAARFSIGLDFATAKNFLNDLNAPQGGRLVDQTTNIQPGLLITFDQTLTSVKNVTAQVGNAYGVATIVKADFAGLPVVKVFYNGELRLSYGSIAFSGLLVQDLLNTTSYLSILGGTRSYKGASGQITLVNIDGNPFAGRWQYGVQLDKKPFKCP